MKKSVGTSLALATLALVAGGIALLGGPNVFSKVLSNLKSTSTPKKEEQPVEKKEAVTEVEEEKQTEGTEIALEEAGKKDIFEEPVKEEHVVDQPVVKPKEPEVRVEAEPQPQRQIKAEAQKPKRGKPIASWTPTKKTVYSNTRYDLTFWTGETIRYENGKPIWSSTRGRLTETEEEKRWRENPNSRLSGNGSGKKGTGIWCLTPRENYEVNDKKDCPKDKKNWWL